MLVGNRADCGLFVHFVFSYIIYLLNVSLGRIFLCCYRFSVKKDLYI